MWNLTHGGVTDTTPTLTREEGRTTTYLLLLPLDASTPLIPNVATQLVLGFVGSFATGVIVRLVLAVVPAGHYVVAAARTEL